MAHIRCLQVDAFSARPFSGNPAAVCLLEHEADAQWMQSVAAEMNLSETAFVWPKGANFGLRWFTPALEVDLCGHATLAAAHAMWETEFVHSGNSIVFETKSGKLIATSAGEWIELDFPATPPEEVEADRLLADSLGAPLSYVGRTKFDYLVLVSSEQELRAISPDFAALKALGTRGVIVTSPADDSGFDFVSRFFAPGSGIDEDPVTGSAHCALAPFWRERTGKTQMVGYQASARGGVVRTRLKDGRVILGGQAVTVWTGQLADQAQPPTLEP
jgi:PhzF family phenazine biosynthesis protein